MAKQRPPAVTAMGVVNIVFGSLALLNGCCGGAALVILVAAFSALPQGGPGQPSPKELLDLIDAEVPAYKYVLMAQVTFDMIRGALLIFSGIGLIRLRPSGRMLGMIYAVVALITGPPVGVYLAMVGNPGMQSAMMKWQEKELAKIRAKGQAVGAAPVPVAPTSNPGFNGAIAVFSVLLASALAVANLIVLNLRSVRRACSGDKRRDRSDEEDDDEHDRRRDRDEFDDRRRDRDDFDDRRRDE